MFAFSLAKIATKPHLTKAVLPSARYWFCANQKQTELMQQVESKIFEILRSAAKCDQSKLSRSATFEQLGFDSLDSDELVVAME